MGHFISIGSLNWLQINSAEPHEVAGTLGAQMMSELCVMQRPSWQNNLRGLVLLILRCYWGSLPEGLQRLTHQCWLRSSAASPVFMFPFARMRPLCSTDTGSRRSNICFLSYQREVPCNTDAEILLHACGMCVCVVVPFRRLGIN